MTAPSPKVEQRLPQRLRQCADMSEAGLNFADTPQACREAANALDLLTPSSDGVKPASVGGLMPMLDEQIERDGRISSFMVRSGLLKDILVELFEHRAFRNTPSGDEIEALRNKFRMVVSHATGGMSQDIDAPVNAISVEITRKINRVWKHAKEVGAAEALAALTPSGDAEGRALKFLAAEYEREGWAGDAARLRSDEPKLTSWEPATIRAIVAALTPPPAPTEAAGLREAAQFLLWLFDRKGPVADSLEAWEALRAALAKSPPAAGGVEGKHPALGPCDWLADNGACASCISLGIPAGPTVTETVKVATAPKPLGDVREDQWLRDRVSNLTIGLEEIRDASWPGEDAVERIRGCASRWLDGSEERLDAQIRASLAAPAVPDREDGDKYRIMLLDLLAVIHRDGGHRTQEIGIKLSWEQALQVSSERIAAYREGIIEECAEIAARWINATGDRSGVAVNIRNEILALKPGSQS